MIGFYEAVKDRLADRARCPAILQAVTGASPLAADALALSTAVTVVVVPLSDQASPIRDASFRVTQVETIRFGVVMALAFPAGFPAFDEARDQIKAALSGWQAEGLSRPVAYAGGRLLDYSPEDGGQWLHLLEFIATTQVSYEAQS